MHTACLRTIFTVSVLCILSSVFIFHWKDYSHQLIVPVLLNHSRPTDFSTLYENIVLLSCSSDSFTAVYCYYLPYIALAWRRLGYEPVILLVGSDEKFAKMPLINLLKNDLNIRYHFFNIDPARSISTSQIIRLFGGFISYEKHSTKDLFVLIADVDLIPINRHLFEVHSNLTNEILAVNAYCCPSERFSYENFLNIHYYPISYVGMKKDLWKKIFLPLDQCSLSANLTVKMIECALQERMKIKIPMNVIKGEKDWDVDQKLLSLLISRAQSLSNVYVDKRRLGYRLDPNKAFHSSQFDSILSYNDVHLPNTNETIILSNHTWNVLSKAFSKLFQNETIQLLSRYHYQTAASVTGYKRTNTIQYKPSAW